MLTGPLGQTRIFICTEHTDMRKSFDSLCGIIRRSMHLDPLTGSLYVFRNKRADRIKVVYWDADGLAMWYKCLQKGTFRFPDLQNFSSAGVEIDASTLRLILDGIDLGSIHRQQRLRIDTPAGRPSPQSLAKTASAFQEPREQNFVTGKP